MNIFEGTNGRVATTSVGCMRWLVSSMLLALTVLLFIFGIREMILLGFIICVPSGWDEHAFWSHIYNLFMALEFIFMIIKYFDENYHFPLRYIIYIGVTSVTRAIMIDHDHMVACGTAILLMVVAYCLVTLRKALLVRFCPEEAENV